MVIILSLLTISLVIALSTIGYLVGKLQAKELIIELLKANNQQTIGEPGFTDIKYKGEPVVKNLTPSKSSVMKYKSPQELQQERDNAAMDKQMNIINNKKDDGILVL